MDARSLVLVAVVVTSAVGVGAAAPAAATQDCSFPFTATDATGAAVTVESSPGRIVVLGASAAQTLWELGARGKVVGMPVQPYTDYLAGSENRTPVMNEGGFTVNTEAVVDLEPDLVLAPNIIPADTVNRLRAAGLTVYRFEAAGSIEAVYAKTRLTGRLTGHCAAAEASVADMQRRIGVVQAAVQGESRPRVVYPLGGGFIAGSGTFIDGVITVAGGENIANRAGIAGYQEVSPEVIVEQNPEWIIRSSTLPRQEIETPAYNDTTAIRREQVVVIDGNLANQPAPRVVEPIETIARALHPEAYAAANATRSPTSSPARGTTSPTPSPAPTETPGQPGFGLGLGVGALLAAVLLWRR